MSNLKKVLFSLLVRGPLAILIAALGLLFLLMLLLPVAMLRILEWLLVFLRRGNFKEEEGERGDDCNPPFPEPVMRRPDPCIYSQGYLASQGVPVTWNNPDIWMAKAATPNVIEPDSYHLEADTDYIVTVRVHNASTDLALGVKVRLLYRPWSFNSPDLLPVDVDAGGQEVVRHINVSGMGSSLVQFTWRTPSVVAGEKRHFCLQAHVSHPLDLNIENNVGQENTNVHSANPGHVAAGEVVDVEVPLFNHARRDARFTFDADAYAIDEEAKVDLELQTNTGVERWSKSRKLGNYGPVMIPATREPTTRRKSHDDVAGAQAPKPLRRWRLRFGRQERYRVTRARYVGHDDFKRKLLATDVALPAGMAFVPPEGGDEVRLAPAETRSLPVQIHVPASAQTGEHYSINVRALRDDGRLIGGVTFLLEVQN